MSNKCQNFATLINHSILFIFWSGIIKIKQNKKGREKRQRNRDERIGTKEETKKHP